MALIEFFKAILRLKEYKGLIFKENINAYIDLEAYKELKRLKEIKENHFMLVRSKKRLPKIKNFKYSEKLHELHKRQNGGKQQAGGISDNENFLEEEPLAVNGTSYPVDNIEHMTSDEESEELMHGQRDSSKSLLKDMA